jgi:hypothetical protein
MNQHQAMHWIDAPAAGRGRVPARFAVRLALFPAVIALGVLAAGCSGSSPASHSAGRSGANPVPSTAAASTATASTPTVPAPPCGGAATIPAAVKASPVAGLNVAADEYNVVNIKVAASDPTWALFYDGPTPAHYSDFQGGHGVVHCVGGQWSVADAGTAEVGCGTGTLPAVPPAILTELGLGCP